MDGEETSEVTASDSNTHAYQEEKPGTFRMTHVDTEMPKSLNTFEDLLEAIGTNGRWNITVLIVCILGKFQYCLHTRVWYTLELKYDFIILLYQTNLHNWNKGKPPATNHISKRIGWFILIRRRNIWVI